MSIHQASVPDQGADAFCLPKPEKEHSAANCGSMLLMQHLVAFLLLKQRHALVLLIEKGVFACYYIDTEGETP